MKLPTLTLRALFLALASPIIFACQSIPEGNDTTDYDICIYGATSAGIIAAYTAAKLGRSVLVLDANSHIGGLSSGGLGKTDIGNKYAVTGIARDFYRRLGQNYGGFEAWYFEPSAASKVFDDLINEGGFEVLTQHELTAIEKDDLRITKADFRTVQGALKSVSAQVFIDATYEGDLLAKAGISYTVGREANSQYGETWNGIQVHRNHNFPDGIDPYKIEGDSSSGLVWGVSDEKLAPTGTGDRKVQAYNFRICLTDSVENQVSITEPNNYDPARYELLLRQIAKMGNEDLFKHFIWDLMPNKKTDINNKGGFSTDMIGANWNYPEGSWEERRKIIQEHVNYTKGLLYFLGHDDRVPAAMREEMLKWGYPRDEYTNNDHFSPQLYIREARRMISDYVMTEHNCVGDKTVEDGIALAAYTMDSHHCQRVVIDGMVKNEGCVEKGRFPPYEIAYRSLVPKKVECSNLVVPICLSASHIAFGSIRMEPVFMVLGQVAAVAADQSITEKTSVQGINIKTLQNKLKTDPYLDGKPADVVVDNRDNTFVQKQGDWTVKERFMRQYKSDYMVAEKSSSLTFTLPVKSAGKYELYYYVPRGNWEEQEMLPLASKAQIKVTTKEKEEGIMVDLLPNRNNWLSLGSYDLTANEEVNVQISTDENEVLIVADAAMAVFAGE